ncbi:MAG: hypothetical protein HW395_34 [candidate division NC10 bacterium]|nr:hypothetical protein [candidate division NC10 bacterium]
MLSVDDNPMLTTMKTMNTKAVFALGYYDGVAGRACRTIRATLTRYPTLTAEQASIYLNGAEDGELGDRWRLDDIQQTIIDASHATAVARVVMGPDGRAVVREGR